MIPKSAQNVIIILVKNGLKLFSHFRSRTLYCLRITLFWICLILLAVLALMKRVLLRELKYELRLCSFTALNLTTLLSILHALPLYLKKPKAPIPLRTFFASIYLCTSQHREAPLIINQIPLLVSLTTNSPSLQAFYSTPHFYS